VRLRTISPAVSGPPELSIDSSVEASDDNATTTILIVSAVAVAVAVAILGAAYLWCS